MILFWGYKGKELTFAIEISTTANDSNESFFIIGVWNYECLTVKFSSYLY